MKDMLAEYKNSLQEKKEIIISIKVHAGAKKTEFKEILKNGVIKINISAVPEKGKANVALIKFLSGAFGVGKNQVGIVAGERDRNKVVKITV